MENIHLVQTSLAGVSNARNIGIENARGDYIAFVDDDDIVSQSYLEELYKFASTEAIVVSNVKTFSVSVLEVGDDYLSLSYKRFFNKVGNIFQMRSFLSTSCCKLIPKLLINDRRFDHKIKLGEDSLFMFQISDKIDKILLSQESAIYYRRLRPNSASRTKRIFSEKLSNYFLLLVRYCEIYFRRPFSYNCCLFLSRIVALIIRVFKS